MDPEAVATLAGLPGSECYLCTLPTRREGNNPEDRSQARRCAQSSSVLATLAAQAATMAPPGIDYRGKDSAPTLASENFVGLHAKPEVHGPAWD